MEYALAALIGLIGMVIFQRTKRKSAEAIVENLETEKSKAKTEGLLEVEEAKREEIKKDTVARKKDLSDEEVRNFYDKLFPNK